MRFPVMREAGELTATVVLVVNRASYVLQVLKVSPDNHVSER